MTGHESGKVSLFDAKTGDEVLNNERAHMDVVTDLQLSPDRTYFITSSKDKTARVRSSPVDPLKSRNDVPDSSLIREKRKLMHLFCRYTTRKP